MTDDTIPREILEGIGIDLVRELALALGPHFQSGDLLNSISYEITDQGRILIYMLPHWAYVEYGTPGRLQGVYSSVDGNSVSIPANPERKMPVHFDGNEFINYITGEPDFALAKHVQLYGTKPYPFVRPVLYHKLQKIANQNVKRYIKNNMSNTNELDKLKKILKKLAGAYSDPLSAGASSIINALSKTSVGKQMRSIRKDYRASTKPLRDASTGVSQFMNRFMR